MSEQDRIYFARRAAEEERLAEEASDPLAAGKPVTLTFSNRSRDSHDFSAKSFFARARIVSGDPSGGEIDLRGGQSRSVTLIPVAGTYKVHCGHFMHKQFGMTGTIIVG